MLEEYGIEVLGPFQKPRLDEHRLAGIVTVDGLPAKRVIAVIDRQTMVFIAFTVSDATTGKWEIIGLPPKAEKSLTVIALDNTGNYNAEVADYISQVATV
jgi:hypothetical protein